MMLGFGLLTMLNVLGLPILLIVGIVAIMWGSVGRRATPMISPPAQAASAPSGPPAARYCSHCGYGLQAAWSHCPNCGAVTGPT